MDKGKELLATLLGAEVTGTEGAGEEAGTDGADEPGTDGAEEAGTEGADEPGTDGAGEVAGGLVAPGVVTFLGGVTTGTDGAGADPDGTGKLGAGGVTDFPGAVPKDKEDAGLVAGMLGFVPTGVEADFDETLLLLVGGLAEDTGGFVVPGVQSKAI